ncbi:MAG TPA: hypothetical protein VFE98_00330 [Candidatus Bathyarchaeia archaeon]|nr:hypothetical protein [Candidatus Bathyarchaeia archaeon]
MRGNHGKTPTIILLTLIITLFGKKKPPPQKETVSREQHTFPVPDVLKKSITGNDATRSRDLLRLASFERDLIGDVMTRIYEAEAKGELKESEKNQLVQRYKSDLKRVDGEIENHRKIVDLYDLESAKEDLLKSFQEKMMEIDLKISQIRPLTTLSSLSRDTKTIDEPQPAPKSEAAPPTNPNKEKQPREKPKNKAEERLDAIREEVLKAMERLEQIETEG